MPLKPFFLPKAEDKNERVNELIKAVSLFMNDVNKVIQELEQQIDDLTP
jgi:hypothetical protein